MSRIGNKSIKVPAGVEVTIANKSVKVKGPKGELNFGLKPSIEVVLENGDLHVSRKGNDKDVKSLHGLTRAILNNMVTGVSKGFERRLELIGVGYRAQATGKKITMHLGYSHPIEFNAPENVKIEMDKEEKNIVIVSGVDKQLVGETAANIRKFRAPEPYKGKGIRYVNEFVRRKAGKAAAKTTA